MRKGFLEEIQEKNRRRSMKKGLWKRRAFAFLVAAAKWYMQQKQKEMKRQKMRLQKKYRQEYMKMAAHCLLTMKEIV